MVTQWMVRKDAPEHDLSDGIKRNFEPKKRWQSAVLVSFFDTPSE